MNDKHYEFNYLTLGQRVAHERQKQELTIEELAKRAGVNKNTVVRFEKGAGTHLKTIYKICGALDVSPYALLENKGLVQDEDYLLWVRDRDRKHELITHFTKLRDRVQNQIRDEPGHIINALGKRLPGGALNCSVLEIVAKKGSERCHPGEEFLFCLTGTVGVEIAGVEFELSKGDGILFWGTDPHHYYNADKEKDISVALSVWIDPTVSEERLQHMEYFTSDKDA